MQLDLHGVKHENVKRLVDVFLWQCMQKKKHIATIITGNSSVMKDIVVSVLKEYNITPHAFFESSGSITFEL